LICGRAGYDDLGVTLARHRLASVLDFDADLAAVVLDRSFITAAARWPRLLTAVGHRLEAQRDRLARQAVITHLPKAEHRVLPAGIVLRLPLTHERAGQIERLDDGSRPRVLASAAPTQSVRLRRGKLSRMV